MTLPFLVPVRTHDGADFFVVECIPVFYQVAQLRFIQKYAMSCFERDDIYFAVVFFWVNMK